MSRLRHFFTVVQNYLYICSSICTAPVHLLQLLQYKSGPSSTFIWCSLIHFSLSAIHFKVGCRQSKVNRLFNLFSPCLYTLSCEIAEQQPRQYGDFENIQRAHLPAERARTTLAPFIYAVCCCACVLQNV